MQHVNAGFAIEGQSMEDMARDTYLGELEQRAKGQAHAEDATEASIAEMRTPIVDEGKVGSTVEEWLGL